MISFIIKLYDKQKRIKEISGESRTNTLVINNEFYEKLVPPYKLDKFEVDFWDMYIVSDNVNIIIQDYTLFPLLTIYKASDGDAQVNLLKTFGVNLHIVGLDVNILQVDDGNLFLADSKIKAINFDLECLGKNQKDEKFLRRHSNYKVELRNCEVKDIKIFYSVNDFMVQNSRIDNLEFLNPIEQIKIRFFLVSMLSYIKAIRLNCIIEKFHLKDCTVEKIYFSTDTQINLTNLSNHFVFDVYNCSSKNFLILGIKEYELIRNSQSKKEFDKEYFETAYQIAKIKGEKDCWLINWFMDKSIGYGFKPFRAFLFSIVFIIIIAFSFSINDTIIHLKNGGILSFNCDSICYSLSQFLNRIYVSAIVFATLGYGEVPPGNWFEKILVIIEASMGIVIYALSVFALTSRYIRKK